jgi:hypothetical protein
MLRITVISDATTIERIVEGWFVQNVILGSQPIDLTPDITSLNGQIVVVVVLGKIDQDLVVRLKHNGNRVVIIHMGDETGEYFDDQVYRHADAVFRNYFFPEHFEIKALSKRLFWIPNGFKSGVGPRDGRAIRAADRRRHIAAFLGWLDNPNAHNDERNSFREAALNCNDLLKVYGTPAFAQGLSAVHYAAEMETSVFAPCPAGNSPETFRLYDALELGCIPITLKHQFLSAKQAMGGVPFPTLESWEELPQFLRLAKEQSHQAPQTFLRMQKACVSWWGKLKAHKAATVAKKLDQLSVK